MSRKEDRMAILGNMCTVQLKPIMAVDHAQRYNIYKHISNNFAFVSRPPLSPLL